MRKRAPADGNWIDSEMAQDYCERFGSFPTSPLWPKATVERAQEEMRAALEGKREALREGEFPLPFPRDLF